MGKTDNNLLIDEVAQCWIFFFYFLTVHLYLAQSVKYALAENFFLITVVAP